jgi:TMEM175 potassium channel family protein
MTESPPPDAPAPDERRPRQGAPDRVIAFTDGVFAIIITILVLEIGVPSDLSEQSLRQALDETGATLIAWVISFLLVGMYWVWHRDLFIQVRAVNRDLVWLNLIFLLPVSLIPFAAAVLGEYHDEPVALHLYGFVLVATGLARVGLFHYVSRRPALLWQPTTPRTRRVGLAISAAPIALYLLAIVLADPAPSVSLIVYFAVPALYFVLITVLRDRPATSKEADDFS